MTNKTAQPVALGSTDGLGPLPEPMRRYDGQPLFGAGQMRDYAAAAVAAERERCKYIVRRYMPVGWSAAYDAMADQGPNV